MTVNGSLSCSFDVVFTPGHTCRLQKGKGEGYVQEERRCARRLIYVMKIMDSVFETVRSNV